MGWLLAWAVLLGLACVSPIVAAVWLVVMGAVYLIEVSNGS